HYKYVRISMHAAMKMAEHAADGGTLEVMGMLIGEVRDQTFIVKDSFPLPVVGTETRVNPQNEAYEYMVQYIAHFNRSSTRGNIVGWYHSHPGYGCWLSGIDVDTQSQNQEFQDPFIAIVIDPTKSLANGKLDIGAFRTVSTPSLATQDQSADMGIHSDRYYSLSVSI
ncbi:hypothetical protein CANCADRAFT_11297, partial [Tortispora caseinolytica NRRL Y-17796]